MPSRKKSEDPHAEREANKYADPIASREYILATLKKANKPLTEAALIRTLDLLPEQEIPLARRLGAMIRDGQLMRNRRGAYCLIDKMDLLRGRVIGHKNGFGFLQLERGGDDLFLNPKQMRQVFDGDVVLAREFGTTRRGQGEATIVEVLERKHTQIVGRLNREQGVWYVTPDDARISQQISIPKKERGKARAGQIVAVEILAQPSISSPAVGRVAEILGDHMAPGMEIDIALRNHEIPVAWPAAVLNEADRYSELVAEEHKKHRVDLRHLPFVTIDGEDARDFDDAVYAERKKRGGWRLWVAIADVSHYVAVGSALDQEAAKRGNSVYFPGRVVPMLPEALSNGLCSLNPNTDRLAMVCEVNVSAAGRAGKHVFYEAVFQSHARLTYTKVGRHIEGNSLLPRKELHKPINTLYDLYKALRQSREQRGAIDFETTETRIVFGADQKIERIEPVRRNEAHKVVEECMLCVNVCAARFLEKQEIPGIYRVHDSPGEEKLINLRGFLAELGLSLGGGAKPKPADYQALSAAIGGRADRHIIQTMMLRSMMQAVYAIDNKGHFGLAYPAYTHFTSPIRRYADLLVHRAIRSVIRSRKLSALVTRMRAAKPLARKNIFPYDAQRLLACAEQCSMTERRADDATRDVVAWLKCEYLMDRIGEVFRGTVNAVTGFGLFVELDDIFVEGLVHVTALNNDYYHFDAARQRLLGERSGAVYRLGDPLTVKLVAVNLEDKKIDLEPADTSAAGNRQGKGGGRSDAKPRANKGSRSKGGKKRNSRRKGKRK